MRLPWDLRVTALAGVEGIGLSVSRQRSLGAGHTDPGLACFSISPWPGSWGPLGLAPTLPPPLSSADGSGCGHRQL